MAEYVDPDPSPRPLASQFSQLSLTIECGRINSSTGLLKPNPYVEVTVDGKPPKKSEICKSTYQPRWNEPITLLVTPYSKIHFRLYDHSTFKKDALLGEHTLDLFNVLKTRDGKCQNSTISLDMTNDAKHGLLNGSGSGSAHPSKVGEVVVVLDGLNIDMKAVPAASPPVMSVVPSPFPPEENGQVSSASSDPSSKQRRRTAEDGSERLPPLAKNQSRGASSTSSLHTNLNGESESSSNGTVLPFISPSESPEGQDASPRRQVSASSFESGHNPVINGAVQARRLLLPPIHQTLG